MRRTIDLRNEVQVDHDSEFYQALGSYWSEIFEDSAVMEVLMDAVQDLSVQADVNLKEAVATRDVKNTPILHTELWYRLLIYKDDLTRGEFNIPLYGEPNVYGQPGLYYNVGNPPVWTFPAPELMTSPTQVSNRVTEPSYLGYQGKSFFYKPGFIGFTFNPFSEPDLFPVIQTDRGEAIQLWMYISLWDVFMLQRAYSAAVGVAGPTTENYRTLIEGIWEGRVRGSSSSSLYKLLSGASGIQLAHEDGEIVEHVFNQGSELIIITDKHVYSYPDSNQAIVGSGEVLVEGQALVDSMRIVTEIKSGGEDIYLPASYFDHNAKVRDRILFPNRRVPVEDQGLDGDGNRVVKFDLAGDAADVKKYRDFSAAAGISHAVDSRGPFANTQPTGDQLNADVNPAVDIVGEMVQGRLCLLYTDMSKWPETGLKRFLQKEADKQIPKRGRLLIQDQAVFDGLDEFSSVSDTSSSTSSLSRSESTNSTDTDSTDSSESSSQSDLSSTSSSQSTISSSTSSGSSSSDSSVSSTSTNNTTSESTDSSSSRSDVSSSSQSESSRTSGSSDSSISSSTSTDSTSSTDTAQSDVSTSSTLTSTSSSQSDLSTRSSSTSSVTESFSSSSSSSISEVSTSSSSQSLSSTSSSTESSSTSSTVNDTESSVSSGSTSSTSSTIGDTESSQSSESSSSTSSTVGDTESTDSSVSSTSSTSPSSNSTVSDTSSSSSAPAPPVMVSGELPDQITFASDNAVEVTLNPSLVSSFDITGSVYGLTIHAGTLYLGGNITTIQGQSRTRLGAIDLGTGNVTAFTPDAPNQVVNTVVHDGTNLYFGGRFTLVGATARNRIAAVDSLGVLQPFDPDADSDVITLTDNGLNILVGGLFTNIGGAARNGAAEIVKTTSVATAWDPDITKDGTQVGSINTILVDGSDIYVGGNIGSVNGGTQRCGVARFNNTTGTVDSWDPEIQMTVHDIVIRNDDVFIGAGFDWYYNWYLANSHDSYPNFGGASIHKVNRISANVDWSSGATDRTGCTFAAPPANPCYGRYAPGPPYYGWYCYCPPPPYNNGYTSCDFPCYPRYGAGCYCAYYVPSNDPQYCGGGIVTTCSYTSNYIYPYGNVYYYTCNYRNAITCIALDNDNDNIVGYGLAPSSGETDTWPWPAPRQGQVTLAQSNGALQSEVLRVGDITTCVQNGSNLILGGDGSLSVNHVSDGLYQVDTATALIDSSFSINSASVNSLTQKILIFNSLIYFGNGTGEIRAVDFDGNLQSWFCPTDNVRDMVGVGPWIYMVDAQNDRLTRWDPNTPNSEDTSFRISFDEEPLTLHYNESEGRLFSGGLFTQTRKTIGSSTNDRFFYQADRTTGARNPSKSPGDGAFCLVIDAGFLWLGGSNMEVDSQGRSGIAKYNLGTETVDPWTPPSISGSVFSLAIYNNEVYATGTFTSVGGNSYPGGVASFDATTGAVTAWDQGVASPNSEMKVVFDTTNDVFYLLADEQSAYHVRRQNKAGALQLSDNTWVQDFRPDTVNGDIYKILLEGGTLYAVGDFSNIGGVTRREAAAFDTSDGSLTTWDPDLNNEGYAITSDASRIYIGGDFTTVGGTARNRYAAVDKTNGALQAEAAGGANGRVRDMKVVGTNLYIAGEFTNVSGSTRNRAAAVDITTNAVQAWNPNFNNTVFSMDYDPVGQIFYFGGTFTTAQASTRNRTAAVNLGGLLITWTESRTTTVHDIIFDSVSGNIFVIGDGLGANEGLSIVDASGTTLATGGGTPSRDYEVGFHTGTRFFAATEFGDVREFDTTTLAEVKTIIEATGSTDVYEMQTDGTNLYFAGRFFTIGLNANQSGSDGDNPCVAQYDTVTKNGTGWATGFNWTKSGTEVLDGFVHNGNLFVCGKFDEIFENNEGPAVIRKHLVEFDVNGVVQPLDLGQGDFENFNHMDYDVGNDRIYISGNYDTIAGQSIPSANRNLRRISSAGVYDNTFEPAGFTANVDLRVKFAGDRLYLWADNLGNISYQGTNYPHYLAFDLSGLPVAGRDFTFTTTGTSTDPTPIRSFAIDDNGSELWIAAGGVDITPASYMLETDPTTGLSFSTPFAPNLDVTDFFEANGLIFVAGAFTDVSGNARNGIFAFDPTNDTIDGFNPTGGEATFAHAAAFDGYVLSVSDYRVNSSISFLTSFDITTGVADQSRRYVTESGQVDAILAVTENQMWLGGDFHAIRHNVTNSLIAVTAATNQLKPIADNVDLGSTPLITSDGSFIYTSSFFSNGDRVRRYDLDGNQDLTWLSTASSTPQATHADGDYVYFGSSGGGSTRGIYRKSVIDGTETRIVTTDFSTINSMVIDSGNLYAVGSFNASGRTRAAAWDASTGALLAWNPNLSSTGRAIAILNSIAYIGGDFTTVGGTARNRGCAIDLVGAGTLQAWDPNFNDHVNAIAVSATHVFAGGEFSSIDVANQNGQATNYLVKLDPISQLAQPAFRTDNDVKAIEYEAGIVYATGNFTTVFDSTSGAFTTRTGSYAFVDGGGLIDYDLNLTSAFSSPSEIAVVGGVVYHLSSSTTLSVVGTNDPCFCELLEANPRPDYGLSLLTSNSIRDFAFL